MAIGRKFGTFGGVFTPSILTILGVIMYLRLPWIVGQAGLYMTIGIVIVAHIISVTTGLSVASIATDKKVSVGGNYYIISRSLGLPIGGTLGIALFVGLSFSISLYIIGFIESFLPAWGIEATREAIRFYGTVAVLAVAGIILISTSLAIRVQYVIMVAIGLSLLSIVFGKAAFVPETPLLARPAEGVSLTMLFGIFFPAVTGFTAGVQMSGDLRDPRRSLPIGTIAAILLGFLVYIGLSVLFAYRIDADTLANNTDVLVEISLFSPLLYAGVWGATLSSAMGSLLGAPRILQATSMDRITPRLFAEGHGPSNEPRNALVLTFFIAEIGILIAELNVIAAIISIFFITTYGFINLTYAVENWASADFRPSFRIPTWVSVVGAAASFIVMIQLDLLAFLGASLILVVLYMYLKKKELTLESGDTWGGVWSSLIRSGLHQLSRRKTAERNWRPNIILFSGGMRARPHLIEFGKWLVDKRGLLSNFDLKEDKKRQSLFTRPEQLVQDDEEALQGIFHRQFECRDLYEGMETIAQVYGFSGIEPNTVMMGWARHSRDPERFTRLIQYFTGLDYNILMLDYDRDRGFGDKRQIDIWWEDGSRNAALSLTILKFLITADEWQRVETRIMIVIDDSTIENRVYKNMTNLIEAQRLEARVRVINNAIENRPLEDIVKIESKDADLILLSIPDVTSYAADQFIERTDTIVADLGSTMLIRASSFFEPLTIGVEASMPPAPTPSLTDDGETTEQALPPLPSLSALSSGSHIAAFNSMMRVYARLERNLQDHAKIEMAAIDEVHVRWLQDLTRLIDRSFQTLDRRVHDMPVPRARRLISGVQSDTLFQLGRLLKHFHETHLPAQQGQMAYALDQLISQIEVAIAECADESPVVYDMAALAPDPADPRSLRLFKWRKRLRHRLFRTPATVHIRIRDLMRAQVDQHLYRTLYAQLESIGVGTYQLMSDLQKWSSALYDAIGVIERHLQEKTLTSVSLEDGKKKLIERLRERGDQVTQRFNEYGYRLLYAGRMMISTASQDITRPDVNRHIAKHYRITRSVADLKDAVRQVPILWARNQELMITFALMDISVMVFQHRLQAIMARVRDDLRLRCENGALAPLGQLETALQSLMSESGQDKTRTVLSPIRTQTPLNEQTLFNELIEGVQEAVADLPESVDIMSEEAFQHLDVRQFGEIETMSIPLRRQVDYLVETELLSPLQYHVAPLYGRIQTCLDVADDVVRLVQFNLKAGVSEDETADEALHDSLQEIISDGLDRVKSEREQTQQELDRLQTVIQERLHATFETLNPVRLTRTALRLSQDIRSQEGRKLLSGVAEQGRTVRKRLQTSVVRMLYRKSEGILLARKLRDLTSGRQPRVETVLGLVESVSPRSEVHARLPFYYRQLFLGKQPIQNEFWIRRPQERQQAERAIQRYRQGFRGGVLVVGDALAGKTMLCRRLAESWCPPQRIFHLFAPDGGAVDPAQFKARLQTAVRTSGDYDDLFQTMPAESVVIIHDLELWWERSPVGMAVIETILSLIDRYSDRCLFLINTNPYSFRLINRITPIEQAFLSIIDCEPFDAEELHQAILLRHRSTGLQFELEGQLETHLSDFALARLFTGYFDCSSGNIGVALQAWISNIEQITGDQLSIRMPVRPDLAPVKQIDRESMVWLQQFVLHKNLTQERLARIFRNAKDLSTHCQALKRAGLIVETPQGVMELNPYVRPFVIQALSEMEML